MLLSSTDRVINFQPDIKLIEKYDTYRIKYVWITRIVSVCTILFVCATIRLYITDHGIWSTIFGLLSLITGFFNVMVWQTSGTTIYSTGMLIPGIITGIEPLQISTIANMSNSENVEELWGFRRIIIKDLPLHERNLGQRVPCVAGFGGSFGETAHGFYEPRPLIWATDDIAAVTATIEKIDAEEWDLLEVLDGITKTELPDMNDDNIAFFNHDLSIRELK